MHGDIKSTCTKRAELTFAIPFSHDCVRSIRLGCQQIRPPWHRLSTTVVVEIVCPSSCQCVWRLLIHPFETYSMLQQNLEHMWCHWDFKLKWGCSCAYAYVCVITGTYSLRWTQLCSFRNAQETRFNSLQDIQWSIPDCSAPRLWRTRRGARAVRCDCHFPSFCCCCHLIFQIRCECVFSWITTVYHEECIKATQLFLLSLESFFSSCFCFFTVFCSHWNALRLGSCN